jgi:hypothetical protein
MCRYPRTDTVRGQDYRLICRHPRTPLESRRPWWFRLLLPCGSPHVMDYWLHRGGLVPVKCSWKYRLGPLLQCSIRYSPVSSANVLMELIPIWLSTPITFAMGELANKIAADSRTFNLRALSALKNRLTDSQRGVYFFIKHPLFILIYCLNMQKYYWK